MTMRTSQDFALDIDRPRIRCGTNAVLNDALFQRASRRCRFPDGGAMGSRVGRGTNQEVLG
jgi:hypothetical protein